MQELKYVKEVKHPTEIGLPRQALNGQIFEMGYLRNGLMDIKTLVEQPDGSAEFSGKLTPNELQFVVEFGLNVLLQNGVQIVDNQDRNLVNGSEHVQ
jgi:hypothetical protein